MRNIILGILITIAMPACAQYDSFDDMAQDMTNHDVPTISVEELSNVLSSQSKVVLLDSREEEEFNVSRIKGSIHVGYDDFKKESVEGFSKDTPIVVYCSVGYRSGEIGEKLRDMGFTNVRNLYGGIFQWVNNSQPIVNEQGQPTDRIHAYNENWGQWLKKGEKVY